MNTLSATGLGAAPDTGVSEENTVAQKGAHPAWRERVAAWIVAGFCMGLVYLYWSA
ncbi:MAG: hypothetical protein JNK85_24940 [Verrucomicrobiales bacterium]|nr:hypothetical protein [Verrucomicrobiales bacterium]